ncbi:MAG: S-layer homology domain-containing protein [Propioniciclava sp.]|uniref:S-layer homology domain-containing protein n=1 Tax=Propioniciclava sp. TaxID=2038686 RepID=UPI0039E55824
MPRIHRLAAAGLGLALTLTPFASTPAQAAPAPRSAIVRTADRIEQTFLDNCTDGRDDWVCTDRLLTEAIIGLAATQDTRYADTLGKMSMILANEVDAATTQDAFYTAQSIIAVDALGLNPRSFGGINLVERLVREWAARPRLIAGWAPSLSVIAFARAGEPVPAAALNAVLAQQNAQTGALGSMSGGQWIPDHLLTALGMVALSTQASTKPAAATALAKAVAWAKSPANATTDATGTYWGKPRATHGGQAAYTAYMLAAIEEVGTTNIDTSRQLSWLIGQQRPDGGFASTVGGTISSPEITVMALPGLTGAGYLKASAASPFTDITRDNQFFREIQWVFLRGIAKGWSEPDDTRTYRPLSAINRDAMAAYLYRMAGEPEYIPPATSPFSDVPTTAPFYKEITWLSYAGITTGWPDGTYRPHGTVNRDAMAAFLYRYANTPAFTPPAKSPFIDVRPADQFYKEMSWLASQRISTGWPDGSYRPLNPVARDAMAAFLLRLDHALTPAQP